MRTNIFVSGLSPSYQDKDLDKLFTPYGKVVSAVIILDLEGQSKGYGFVVMEDRDQTETAIKELNGKTPKDCKYSLVVKKRTVI